MQEIERKVEPPRSLSTATLILEHPPEKEAKVTCWGRRDESFTHVLISIEVILGFVFFYSTPALTKVWLCTCHTNSDMAMTFAEWFAGRLHSRTSPSYTSCFHRLI